MLIDVTKKNEVWLNAEFKLTSMDVANAIGAWLKTNRPDFFSKLTPGSNVKISVEHEIDLKGSDYAGCVVRANFKMEDIVNDSEFKFEAPLQIEAIEKPIEETE